MKPVLFHADPYAGSVILLDETHPLHGQVFVPCRMLAPSDAPSLTNPNCLVPTHVRLTGDALSNAIKHARDEAEGKYEADGLCQCPDCFTARTNYPH